MIAIPPALARSVLDDAPDAMIIIDAFGVVWFANRQVSALFGYAHGEIIGESVEKLIPERFRTLHVAQRGHFSNNVRVRAMSSSLELFGQRRDGSEFPLEISLSPVEDVGRTLVAAAIRDMSGRKRVEAELIVARDAVQAMREMTDRANADKTRLQRAGHDLGGPPQAVELLNVALRRTVSDPAAVDALSQQAQAIGVLSRKLDALLDEPKPVEKY